MLVNPATCFRDSLGGLSSLIAATNLLSVFPRPLYEASVRRRVCEMHKSLAQCGMPCCWPALCVHSCSPHFTALRRGLQHFDIAADALAGALAPYCGLRGPT